MGTVRELKPQEANEQWVARMNGKPIGTEGYVKEPNKDRTPKEIGYFKKKSLTLRVGLATFGLIALGGLYEIVGSLSTPLDIDHSPTIIKKTISKKNSEEINYNGKTFKEINYNGKTFLIEIEKGAIQSIYSGGASNSDFIELKEIEKIRLELILEGRGFL